MFFAQWRRIRSHVVRRGGFQTAAERHGHAVAIRAGIPGFDFGFAGTPNDYHTPLDTIANLDLGTLQHHGDNVLPLVQAFADGDLSARAPNYVYTNITSSIWLAYSPAAGRIAAILATMLLAIATWRRWQGLAQFVGAFGVVAVALIAIVAFEFGVLAIAGHIAGTRVAWPAQPWPWRLLLYATPVFVLSMLRPLVHRIGFWHTWFAPWWLWNLLLLAQAWLMPLATHVMLPAALAAGGVTVLLAFSQRLDRPAIRLPRQRSMRSSPAISCCRSFTSENWCKAGRLRP